MSPHTLLRPWTPLSVAVSVPGEAWLPPSVRPAQRLRVAVSGPPPRPAGPCPPEWPPGLLATHFWAVSTFWLPRTHVYKLLFEHPFIIIGLKLKIQKNI